MQSSINKSRPTQSDLVFSFFVKTSSSEIITAIKEKNSKALTAWIISELLPKKQQDDILFSNTEITVESKKNEYVLRKTGNEA